jgi:hypothetical protein
MRVLEYPDNMRKIISILPFHLHDRWRSVVLSAQERGRAVDFHMLVDFTRIEAKNVNHPIYGRGAVLDKQIESTKKTAAKGQKISPRHRSSAATVTNQTGRCL